MTDPHSSPTPHALNYSNLTAQQATSIYIGGGLGIGGNLIGLIIFALACFGFEAAFKLSLLPLILGVAGFLLSFFGALFTRKRVADMHVVAAVFINLFAIVGALLEMSVWLNWQVFQSAA